MKKIIPYAIPKNTATRQQIKAFAISFSFVSSARQQTPFKLCNLCGLILI